MLVLDGKTLVYDRPFSHDGINYPANWLRLTTLAEKQAIGIVEQPDPVTQGYDQRFWWGVDNPKDLDDLKTLWKDKTSETSTLGAPTNASGGQSGSIFILQDGTGSRTLAYNAVFAFAGGTAPTLTTTASGQDALLYYVQDPSTIITTSVLNIS